MRRERPPVHGVPIYQATCDAAYATPHSRRRRLSLRVASSPGGRTASSPLDAEVAGLAGGGRGAARRPSRPAPAAPSVTLTVDSRSASRPCRRARTSIRPPARRRRRRRDHDGRRLPSTSASTRSCDDQHAARSVSVGRRGCRARARSTTVAASQRRSVDGDQLGALQLGVDLGGLVVERRVRSPWADVGPGEQRTEPGRRAASALRQRRGRQRRRASWWRRCRRRSSCRGRAGRRRAWRRRSPGRRPASTAPASRQLTVVGARPEGPRASPCAAAAGRPAAGPERAR